MVRFESRQDLELHRFCKCNHLRSFHFNLKDNCLINYCTCSKFVGLSDTENKIKWGNI
jgi:hypothetical protein